MTSTPDPELALDDAQIDLVPLLPEQEAETAGQQQGETDAPTAEEAAPAVEAFEPKPATPTLQQLELAQRALDEIAPAGAVGEVHDALQIGEQVVAIRYSSSLEAYPDWLWTASLATVDPEHPTVLELALLPTETSLLAPAWVPWADRLAEYLASQEAEGETADDTDDSDDSEDDHDDFDEVDDEHFAPEDDDDEWDEDDDSDEDDESDD